MKKFFAVIIFLFLFFLTKSQNITFEKKFVWHKDTLYANGKKIVLFGFDGAKYDNEGIAYFSQIIPLDIDANDVDFQIITKKTSPLNHKLPYKINRDFAINANIYYAREKPYLVVEFYPFYKEKGNIFKIDFIKINFKPKKKRNIYKKYVSASVLATGKWVKIGITQTGVYKITFDKLRELGFDNPQNVRVFGNDFGMLSFWNKDSFPDDLKENKIYYGEDYILFFAKSPHVWYYDTTAAMFLRRTHLFSDTAYYFLTDKNTEFDNVINTYTETQNENKTITTYDYYSTQEQDLINILNSGRIWLGESFSFETDKTFSFSVPNAVSSQAKIKLALAGRSFTNASFTVKYPGGQDIIPIERSYEEDYKKYADYKTRIYAFTNSSSDVSVEIIYNKPTASSEGWLDYITLNCKRGLVYNDNQLIFRSLESVGENNVSRFIISNANSNLWVWDVTNPTEPKKLTTNLQGTNLSFKTQTKYLKEFIVFDPTNCPAPVFLNNYNVENQNLHGISSATDMLIITYPDFLEAANQIADFHKTHDNLNVVTVTTTQVYNEFSSGIPDVSAMRNFIRFVYFKTAKRLKYVLLFGDGSYYNKCSDPYECSNFILTYETENSFNDNSQLSMVSDDYFALLDENEGELSGLLDVGVGRLPIQNVEQANDYVNKLKTYNSYESFGDWRNIITLIADDEEGNSFMQDAEQLSNKIDTLYPYFNIKKIFFDAYEETISASGEAYPGVTEAISNRVENGTLVMAYLGHGNQFLLAHEHVLYEQDIENWSNLNKLTFFITGTCEFGKFDAYKPNDPKYKTSAAEAGVLNPNGGTIGMLSTARASYISVNTQITSTFFSHIFSGKLADALIQTKNSIYDNGAHNFLLFADPAVRIQYPFYNIKITKINSISAENFNDTLKALDFVSIEGQITDYSGNVLTDFDGLVSLSFYDKKQILNTLNNDGTGIFKYWNQLNALFKGQATVEKGNFKISFFIPKDINYNYGKAKFSLYAYSQNIDAKGFDNDVITGGINENAPDDKTGPQIRLFMNDTNFVNGGITTSSPTLLALLYDEHGINTSSSGFGHDISAILDNDNTKIYILNEYYKADLNTYKSGKVEFNFYDLELGEHNLKLKAWDIYNNPSEAELNFVVVDNKDLEIKHLLNYPNPFTTNTDFYFEHNKPGVPLDIILQIFTVSGKLVKTIHTTMTTEGFRSDPINWDGLDDYGNKIGKGVYIYRVKIMTPDGKTADAYEKLLILR